MTTLTDNSSITQRVRFGSMDDYGELFAGNVGRAYQYAHHFVHSRADADDLVAEAFERVLDMLRRGLGPDDNAFWLYLQHTIRSCAVNLYRTRRLADAAAIASLKTTVPALDLAEIVAERRRNDMELRLVRAFGKLSPRHRLVLLMTVIEGLPPITVALALGKSPNQVSALAYRARHALRDLYEAEPPAAADRQHQSHDASKR